MSVLARRQRRGGGRRPRCRRGDRPTGTTYVAPPESGKLPPAPQPAKPVAVKPAPVQPAPKPAKPKPAPFNDDPIVVVETPTPARAGGAQLFAHPKIEVALGFRPCDAIIGRDDPMAVTRARLKNVKTGEMQERAVDGIFIAIGHAPAVELFTADRRAGRR